MKKSVKHLIAVVSLCVGSLLASVIAANAYTVGTVTADSLNVRADMSTSSEVLVALTQGSQVVLMERIGDWYKVNIGIFGYVKAEYIADPTDAGYQAPAPEQLPAQEATTVSDKQRMIVETAKSYLGVPYVYGGSSPSGFDCSGLCQYVYKKCGYNINRVAAAQAENGTPVSRENLQPGDLVFFKKAGAAIHHVGIYVGDGNYIHAPYTGTVVKIQPLSSRSDYYCARRIVN